MFVKSFLYNMTPNSNGHIEVTIKVPKCSEIDEVEIEITEKDLRGMLHCIEMSKMFK